MTDAAKAIKIKPELKPWFEAWKTCTQDVLSQVAGKPHALGIVETPLPVADSDLRYTIATAGAVQGELALRLPEGSGIHLARMFLGGEPAPPVATPETVVAITNEDREALEEFLRQIAGLAATALAPAAGGEIRFQLSAAEAPWSGTSDAVVSLRTDAESGTEIAIEIRISPAMAAVLATRASAASPANPPPSSAAAVTSSASAAFKSVASTLDSHAAGYRRLLDVGLGVKLRFGTRRMLLRDVLALSSGLVVELEDALDSPVDLLLDGRIIARGEVVVVDGKYGLRVTQVADPAPSEIPLAGS
jgi:flagellar motor switch protein FliN